MKGIWHPRVAAGCFLVGLGLVFLINEEIARIVGVPLIFTGIFLGVFAIADPAFLERDRGPDT
jgi:disulfide bond formation protein DsbB